MERWPLERQTWLRFVGYSFAVFIAALGFLFPLFFACWCISGNRLAEGPYVVSFLLGLLCLPFSVLFAYILKISIIDCFTRVYFTSQGVERRRFGKCHWSIPWDELAEAGIAREVRPRGVTFRVLYFSPRPLEEHERIRFYSTSYNFERGTPISVDCTKIQNFEKLKEFCPLPIPSISAQEDYSTRYDLLSYRRERNEQGGWGEVAPSFLLTSEVERRFEQNTTRRKK